MSSILLKIQYWKRSTASILDKTVSCLIYSSSSVVLNSVPRNRKSLDRALQVRVWGTFRPRTFNSLAKMVQNHSDPWPVRSLQVIDGEDRLPGRLRLPNIHQLSKKAGMPPVLVSSTISPLIKHHHQSCLSIGWWTVLNECRSLALNITVVYYNFASNQCIYYTTGLDMLALKWRNSVSHLLSDILLTVSATILKYSHEDNLFLLRKNFIKTVIKWEEFLQEHKSNVEVIFIV